MGLRIGASSFHRCIRTLLLGAALTGSSVPGAAQVRLHGRVIQDSTGVPIEDVRVTLLSRSGERLGVHYTDASGSFAFLVRRVRAVQLRAERVGYRETLTPTLYFDRYDDYGVEIRLDRAVALLAPLEVVARSDVRPSPVLSGFRHRMKIGMGVYITREEIERRHPMYVSDVLALVPGVHLLSSGRGSARTVVMSRAPTCAARIYVDGMLMNPGGAAGAPAVDEVVSPASVEGIEVYRGLSTVPPEFLSPQAKCGVVVIWTRRGDAG